MRTVIYLQSGETQGCIGCHAPRSAAPKPSAPTAAKRPPSRLRPEGEGSWPLRFDRLVEPTIQRLQALNDPKLAGLELGLPKPWKRAPVKNYNTRPNDSEGGADSYLWKTLVDFGGEQSLFVLARDQDCEAGFRPSPPENCLASQAVLWDKLTAPIGSQLTEDEKARLALWMDLYAHFKGHFTDQQEADIAALRQRWAGLLEEIAKLQGRSGDRRSMVRR